LALYIPFCLIEVMLRSYAMHDRNTSYLVFVNHALEVTHGAFRGFFLGFL